MVSRRDTVKAAKRGGRDRMNGKYKTSRKITLVSKGPTIKRNRNYVPFMIFSKQKLSSMRLSYIERIESGVRGVKVMIGP